MPSLSKLAAVAIGAFTLTEAKVCPPLGAVLPAPQAPSEAKVVKDAASRLKLAIDEQTTLLNTSAISLNVKSIHEDDSIFSYHFTPPNTGEGVDKVDENTVFRIASGSKLFTVLAALINSDIDMEASVLKYLPELKETAKGDPIMSLSWENITVGSLASHLSGVGVDMAQDLGIVGSEPWAALGLPQFAKGKGPTCSGLPGTIPCTKNDLLEQVNLRPPVYAPYTNPVYSNVGVALLGLVVEAANNKTFAEVIQKDILDVLGMKNTYVSETPSTDDLFIPAGEPTWNSSLAVFDSAGGMFSSVHDMTLFAEAILKNMFLSPAETRKWMKPAANTASWGYQVGGPWEILRTDNITSDGRLIDIYTKSGDLGLYHSQTVLIPDYDIVISLITGGLEASAHPFVTTTLLSGIIQTLIPAVEQVGREEAKRVFAGDYADTSSNSSISFKIDEGPGLVISSWQVRGFDVLGHIGAYNFNTLESGEATETKYVEARVYPTNLDDGKDQTAWRAVFNTVPAEQDAKFESSLFFKDGACQTWFQQDRKTYNFLSLDEFVFVEGEQGDSASVRNPAFNVTLSKVRQPAEKKTPASAASRVSSGNVACGMAALTVLMSLF